MPPSGVGRLDQGPLEHRPLGSSPTHGKGEGLVQHGPPTTSFADRDVSADELPSNRHVDAWEFERCCFRYADLAGLVTTNCRFVSCDLTGVDLTASTHTGSAFTNCRFEGARLSTATFLDCKLTGSEMTDTATMGLSIRHGDWSYVNLRGTDLHGRDLAGLRLAHADLSGADLSGADLTGADLRSAILRGTRLAAARLVDTDLAGSSLAEAELRGAILDIAGAVHLARSFGVQVE